MSLLDTLLHFNTILLTNRLYHNMELNYFDRIIFSGKKIVRIPQNTLNGTRHVPGNFVLDRKLYHHLVGSLSK